MLDAFRRFPWFCCGLIRIGIDEIDVGPSLEQYGCGEPRHARVKFADLRCRVGDVVFWLV